jgi:hypothetical protein
VVIRGSAGASKGRASVCCRGYVRAPAEVDLLLDPLLGALRRLLDLLLDLRFPDHDHGGASLVERLTEVLEVAARHPLP